MCNRENAVRALQKEWAENPRWQGIKRDYSAEEVIRLRGSRAIEHTIARQGAEKLWDLLHSEPFVNTVGALTGSTEEAQFESGNAHA